uniref:RUS family member 1 n=1 Tax=Paramormyrops kingsleyae TaxID=1676925 RepID=A0A3B3TEQ7_9TELE
MHKCRVESMDQKKETALVTERYGSQEEWTYRLNKGVLKRERLDAGGATKPFLGFFKSVFLPQGYPDSVSGDYLQYQFWDTIQAFSSSLSGTLSTQASLRGVGVGNQEATVAAATVTWLLRDGTGMLGRILFAWVKGSKLDCDAKKWRLVADVLNDIAMFMEILAPSFPACFTFIVCIAGILKSIVGVAGGATRAALTLHQARRDNMADVSAKDGSQETLVNLAGLLVSLVLIPLVTNNALLTFVLFFSFTVLHLLANYKAVRSIVMETLNEARLSILLHQYLHDGRILSPSEANSREPVFLEFRRRVPIKFGVKFGDLITRYVCRPSLLSFLSSPVCFLCPSFFFSLPFLFLPMSLFTLAHPVVLSFLPLSFLFSVSCCPFLSSSVFSLLFSVSCCPFLSSCRCSPAHSVSFVICFLLSFLSCSVFPVSLSFFSFSASSPLLHVFPVPFLSSCLFSPVQFSLCPFFSPFCLFSLLPVLLSVSFPAKFPGHPAWTLPRPLRERV